MSSRAVAAGLLVLTLGCEGWEPVLIESEDFQPMLNVLAVLSPDLGGVVEVQVQRILPLEGPSWDGGEQSSRYKVTEATVVLTHGTTTYELLYDPERSRYKDSGHYVAIDTGFIPLAGATYGLTVETPDGLALTGETTIPVQSRIMAGHTPDTLGALDPIPVAWRKSSGYYRLSYGIVQSFDLRSCYEPNVVTVLEDTTWLAEPLTCDGPDTPDGSVDELIISVTAMDENYYNYFVRDPAARSDFSLIFLGEGDTGAAYGVEGGLGVFGSFRYATLRRLVAP